MRVTRGRTFVRLAVAGIAMGTLGIAPALVASAPDAGATAPVHLHAGGSVDEAWLTGASPGERVTLHRNGAKVSVAGNPARADSLGSSILRDLPPGAGYSWVETETGQTSRSFAVLAPGADPPRSSSLYTGQTMHQGLNYITMRDGIQLAATVRYPYGSTCNATAPCPTVIEYSGYATAAPTDPIPSLLAQATHSACTACGDKDLLPDTATDVGAVVARMAGFATVSLQMRGTGCSGGAYDLFGYPSDYDAYDAVEIVAHQDWVANHKVGMVGISYSGLSELPSAGTDPPDLAAIAPMSPTDDLFSTGYPGGIYNDGFAAGWIASRIDDAKAAATLTGGSLAPLSTTPVSGVGQSWVYYEIDAELAASGGASSTCLANQALHEQSESLSSLVGPQLVAPGTGPGRDPSLFDRRSMDAWAARITVPVFISGAMQDEQTGPQWPALLSALPKTTPVFANLVNGGHIDSTDPQIISRWLEFLDLYVADKVPAPVNFLEGLVLDDFTSFAAGTSAQAPLPAIRFTAAKNLTVARHDFTHQTPRVELLFDNGAGAVGAGDPQSTYTAGFNQWPPAGRTQNWWLGAGGVLATHGAAPRTGSGAARPWGAPRHRPPDRQRLGRRSGVGLDTGPGGRRGGLPDGALHVVHHHRRAGDPRPLGGVGLAGRRPPGHHHRGATGQRTGGVRDVRFPAQLEPGGPTVVDGAIDPADLPARRFSEAVGVEAHPGQDPRRPDRPHLPCRDRAPGGAVGTRRRPPDLGVRHGGRRQPDGVGRLRRGCGLEPRGRRGPRGARHGVAAGMWFAAGRAVPHLSGRGQPVLTGRQRRDQRCDRAGSVGGSSPVSLSTGSRSRSAWPRWAYSSTSARCFTSPPSVMAEAPTAARRPAASRPPHVQAHVARSSPGSGQVDGGCRGWKVLSRSVRARGPGSTSGGGR